MGNEFNLVVNKRDLTTKGGMKQMRKTGQIPGVYYSHDSKSSSSFTIDISELRNAQKSGARVFSINVGDKKRTVLFKSVQYHPVTDEIIHIDLYGVKMDQAVSVNVNISLVGTAKGVQEEGGILVQGISELEVECLPNNIPESIEIDISNLELGQSFRVEDMASIKDVAIKTSEDQILASITQAMQEEIQEPSAEDDAEETESDDSSDDSSEEQQSEDSQ